VTEGQVPCLHAWCHIHQDLSVAFGSCSTRPRLIWYVLRSVLQLPNATGKSDVLLVTAFARLC
jgi:hypothetical protein